MSVRASSRLPLTCCSLLLCRQIRVHFKHLFPLRRLRHEEQESFRTGIEVSVKSGPPQPEPICADAAEEDCHRNVVAMSLHLTLGSNGSRTAMQMQMQMDAHRGGQGVGEEFFND